jgi:DNA modification methylase
VSVSILIGDCREKLREMPDASVNCCITSPPYFGLRDYGVDGQMGLEPTPDEFVAGMVEVFREVRRVLRDDGTLWLNIGDSYASVAGGYSETGSRGATAIIGAKTQAAVRKGACRKPPLGLKAKDLIGIPWELAKALRAPYYTGRIKSELDRVWLAAMIDGEGCMFDLHNGLTPAIDFPAPKSLYEPGWYLRQDIIWSKSNPMPESVRDRCTKAHEYLFMLSKSARYYYDAEAIAEPSTWDPGKSKMPDGWDTGPGGHGAFHRNGREKGRRTDKQRGHGRRHAGFNDRWDAMEKAEQCSGTRNKRSVWEVATQPFSEAHFATYPPALIEPCILAGCPTGSTVLDPFGGAGTTGLVADRLGRNAVLIELNPEYAAIAERRLNADSPLFAEVKAA